MNKKEIGAILITSTIVISIIVYTVISGLNILIGKDNFQDSHFAHEERIIVPKHIFLQYEGNNMNGLKIKNLINQTVNYNMKIQQSNRFVSLELDGQVIVEAQNDGVFPNMENIKNTKRYTVDFEFYEDDDRYVKKVIVNQT